MKRLEAISWVLFIWFSLSSFTHLDYEWKNQGMQFSLPDYFIQQVNDDVKFVAAGNEMTFQLNVYMDDIIEADEISSFVSKMGTQFYGLNNSLGSGVLKGQGYTGYFIYGEVEGKLVYVVGLLESSSGIGYVGNISYGSDIDNSDPKVAQRILNSFSKRGI